MTEIRKKRADREKNGFRRISFFGKTGRTAFIACLLAAAVLMSACGKNPSDSTGSTDNSGSTENAESTDNSSSTENAESTDNTGSGESTDASEKEADLPAIEDYGVIHESEFGGVYIEMTIDDFNKQGFQYGDSVNVVFSNGYRLDDIPYYNGYYVDAGEPLLIAYPGYEYIKAAINYGEDLWDKAELQGIKLQAGQEPRLWKKAALDEHSKASVYLNERGKYKKIQEARDIHYYDEREKYDSDEMFANFRCMTAGRLKPDTLYRSASPCDNQHKRAPYVDKLIEKAGIRCILNLADNEKKIAGYLETPDFDSPYFKTLYEAGGVIPVALNMNWFSDEFRTKLADGLRELMKHDGPYLVHCTEGKDRTGFVCMLLEALAGASCQEIVDDYMLTYDNYYHINEKQDKEKYDVILEKNLVAMLKTVINDDSTTPEKADLEARAEAYLKGLGMTEEEVQNLKKTIAG